MPANGYPENPVLCRALRGRWVESQHRGAWALVDAAGAVVESDGDVEAPVFARSAIKGLQALPLLESGAADDLALGGEELALAASSHDAEAQHTERVAAWLARLGMSDRDLRCGAQRPGDRAARRALEDAGAAPTALHNNCSGKHTGFLSLARHLGEDPATYLAPDGATQRVVRDAVADLCGEDAATLEHAVDGCSAPTYRLSLRAMATGVARLASPGDLAPARRAACERVTAAVAAHPELVAGRRGRLCTDLVRATGGRLYGKIGAEAVYVVAPRGGGLGLAVKVDDGGRRALSAVVLALLARRGLLAEDELAALGDWRGGVLRNWAGLEVGRLEVLA